MEHTANEENLLLEILLIMFPDSSKSKLRKMLTTGRVNINGIPEYKAKAIVLKGDKIKITTLKEAIVNSPSPKSISQLSKLSILYEDNELIIVNKPTGLLSVSTNKLENDTLHSRCVDYMKKKSRKNWCHIVHRLDRDTSGIMIFAKNIKAKENLQSQFATRSVERIYHALVEGVPDESKGTDLAWIYEDKKLNVKRVKSNFKGAREAITHWNILDDNDSFSLVEIKIDTGRRHQIRLAMKYLNCPVVGDILHGSIFNPFKRICLHATKIRFIHPTTNKSMEIDSPVPFKI